MAFKILNSAIANTTDTVTLSDLKFSNYFLLRVKGIEAKDSSLIEEANTGLKYLCRDEHPASLYVLGKELFIMRDSLKDLQGQKAQEKARLFLKLSCDKGFPPSFFYLAQMYELGIGGPANQELADEFYEKSQVLGDPQAFFILSQKAEKAGDKEKSFEYLKESAELGLLEAQHNLAVKYSELNDNVKAMAWFLQAAKYNFFPSMVNAGMIFLRGNEEIMANPVAAYIWLSQAQTFQNSEDLEKLIETAKQQISIYKNGT